jgi:hypothetical protein
VGDVIALVAAVAARIGAGSGAGLTGLEAESGTRLDRGESGFGDAAAEDGGERAGDGSTDDGTARGFAADELGQVVKPAIVHSDSLMQRTGVGYANDKRYVRATEMGPSRIACVRVTTR